MEPVEMGDDDDAAVVGQGSLSDFRARFPADDIVKIILVGESATTVWECVRMPDSRLGEKWSK